MQSALNSVTQSTQSTMSWSELTAWPHAGSLPGGSTFGQVAANPIWATVKSSGPPHVLSAPPHAAQILATFLASAFVIAALAVPSGQDPEPFARTPSAHLPSAFRLASKNF